MSDIVQTPDGAKSKMKRGSFSTWKGNRYPQVKLRGFYSDIISNENADKIGINEDIPDASHCHMWEVNKEKHLPLSKYFKISS